MAGRVGLISADLSSGLATAVRTAREVDLSDPLDMIRADLSGGIDVGRELVGDAAETLAETVARLQGRSRRRSRRGPAIVALGIGLVGALAIAAWWLRRRSGEVAARDERLDRGSLDRAADDGMGAVIGSPEPEISQRERVPVAIEIEAADASGA